MPFVLLMIQLLVEKAEEGGGGYFASARVIQTTPNGLGGWQAVVLNYGPTDAILRPFAVCLGLSS